MLSSLAVSSWTASTWLLAFLGAFWAVDALILALKLRGSAGVRAHVLASNPFRSWSFPDLIPRHHVCSPEFLHSMANLLRDFVLKEKT